MCSRELLVKNVPQLSSVFERTINPHSSNAYIVLCTYRPLFSLFLAFWPSSSFGWYQNEHISDFLYVIV